MKFSRFIKGPQIHFWISDKVVSPTAPSAGGDKKEKQPEGLTIQHKTQLGKEQEIPQHYHVEIF